MQKDFDKTLISQLDVIPSGVLSPARPAPFDLFVCENKKDCVLLCSKEYPLSGDRLKDLKLNRAEIFVRKDELPFLRNYLKKSVLDISKSQSVTREERSQMVYSTAVMVVDELFNNVESKEAVEDSKGLATVVLDNLLRDNATFLSMVGVLSYDYYTYSHCVNVCIYSIAIGKKLGLSHDDIEELGHAAILHDIGKAHIDPKILNKEGALDTDEFEIMKTHTTLGRDAIIHAEKQLGAQVEFLKIAKEIAYYHQEKWDGSGYPTGISGDDIPISARLMAVADVYDALISRRVYKEGMPHEKAVSIITEGKGTHFDADIVDAFLEIQDEFRAIASRFVDSDKDMSEKALLLARLDSADKAK